jgi:hypothetical protein
MIERLAAAAGGLQRDAKLLADDVLADALVEGPRAERGQEVLIVRQRLGEDAVDGHGEGL